MVPSHILATHQEAQGRVHTTMRCHGEGASETDGSCVHYTVDFILSDNTQILFCNVKL